MGDRGWVIVMMLLVCASSIALAGAGEPPVGPLADTYGPTVAGDSTPSLHTLGTTLTFSVNLVDESGVNDAQVETWQGTLSHHDPDAKVVEVELVAWNEAIHRLEQNGGWAGIQAPLLAYLRGTAPAGTFWFYREDTEGQQLIESVPAGDRASMSFPRGSSGNSGSTLSIETRP